ncbi:MAG: lysophospholipase [Planctomycetes bacterium]|nr:lysophospholipase [Planctomycetota bacterium]
MSWFSSIVLGVLLAAQATAPATTPPAAPAAPAVPAAAAPKEEPFKLDTDTGVIRGSLLMPGGTGPFPVALIIAGSGPTDRDGNSGALKGKNNSLQMLAQSLAEANIASVRFDKRGISASRAAGPSEANLRFENYVDDAAAWVEKLRRDPRFSTITIIGHSEGSLIGAIAASRVHPDAFVSLAGVARPAGLILREQMNGKLTPELFQANEKILSELESGRTINAVPAALQALYRPSVQPYLISWFKHNPAKIFADLKVPILIGQGTTDIQVAVEEAEALKKAAPSAQLVMIEGMNHVLKTVPAVQAKQLASYSDPALPINPELTKRVIDFIPRTKSAK